MIAKGTKICVGPRTAFRQVAVETLIPVPFAEQEPSAADVELLTIDRESEPTRAFGNVAAVAGHVAPVLVTLTDGQEFRCSPDTGVLVVDDATYSYTRAIDLAPGTMLVPLGKWRPPFRPPAGKIVASVAAAEAIAVLYAVRVTGPRQNYAIAAGVYLAADKE